MVGGYKHVYILPPPTGNQFQKKKKNCPKIFRTKKKQKKKELRLINGKSASMFMIF